jgi:hypothetical protein
LSPLRESAAVFDEDVRGHTPSRGSFWVLPRSLGGLPYPFNIPFALLGLMAELAGTLGTDLYRARVEAAVRHFNYFARRIPGDAFFWVYGPGGRPEDVSHGGIVAANILVLRAVWPHLFNAGELASFANILPNNVFDGTRFSVYIDGSGGSDPEFRPERACAVWMDYQRYNPKLLSVCDRAYKTARSTTRLWPVMRLKWK